MRVMVRVRVSIYLEGDEVELDAEGADDRVRGGGDGRQHVALGRIESLTEVETDHSDECVLERVKGGVRHPGLGPKLEPLGR